MTLFKLLRNIPVVATKNDVIAPTKVIIIKALGGYSNKGEHLAIIKTFVVTIVITLIRTDIRVGYSSSFYVSTRLENKDFGVLGNELVSLTRIGTRSSTYEIKTFPKIYKMATVLLTTKMFFFFYA
jgi:hypothetical protein